MLTNAFLSSGLIINSFVNSFPLLEKQYSSNLEKKNIVQILRKKICEFLAKDTQIFANYWKKSCKLLEKDMQILTKFSPSFDKKILRIFGVEGWHHEISALGDSHPSDASADWFPLVHQRQNTALKYCRKPSNNTPSKTVMKKTQENQLGKKSFHENGEGSQ